jgi:ubiquitin-activating enzyme E1
MRCFL